MPRNQLQRMIFAFLTVVITVHGYVFYSLYVVNGAVLMQATGADSVLHAIAAQGGVYMFGKMLPIWAVIIIEFFCAYALECLFGSPVSYKMACKMFDPQKHHPMIFETVIISCTVLIMCPLMSFFCGVDVLSLLCNISHPDIACKLVETCMLSLSICVLFSDFLYSAICTVGF